MRNIKEYIQEGFKFGKNQMSKYLSFKDIINKINKNIIHKLDSSDTKEIENTFNKIFLSNENFIKSLNNNEKGLCDLEFEEITKDNVSRTEWNLINEQTMHLVNQPLNTYENRFKSIPCQLYINIHKDIYAWFVSTEEKNKDDFFYYIYISYLKDNYISDNNQVDLIYKIV